MSEFGKKLNTKQLSADWAHQVSSVLQNSLSDAGAAAYKAFLESYNPIDPDNHKCCKLYS